VLNNFARDLREQSDHISELAQAQQTGSTNCVPTSVVTNVQEVGVMDKHLLVDQRWTCLPKP
jgi:hypothetical protein